MSARSVVALVWLLTLASPCAWGQAVTPSVPPPSAVTTPHAPVKVVAPTAPGGANVAGAAAAPFTPQQVQEIRTLCSRAADWKSFSVCVELRPAAP